VRLALLTGLLAIAAVVMSLPAGASAASCPVVPGVFATSWGGGSGSFGDDTHWSNGTPSSSCDASITAAGDYTVTMTGGANAKSFTLGGPGSTPHLIISDQSPNTNLDAQPAGITIAAGASVTLTCLPGGCPGGGPDIFSGTSPFANAGVITVDENTGGGAVVGGAIANTGVIDFEQSGSLSGVVVNQGTISISDGKTATNQGSSCGDPTASVKNDVDGVIDGGSTGVLSVRNFEQGDGVTKDVLIPCGGTLGYSGDGASEIRATGGFNLSGEMRAGQNLTISAESANTNAVLQGSFTSKGTITLTCPAFGCNGGPGGGAGFDVNDEDFVNAGTFTVDASSGTGASVGPGSDGTLVNTGTMSFDQSARLKGPVLNQGAIDIADGKVASSFGDSCADAGSRVKNDSGGSINGTGSGYLEVRHYEQGAGTTSGSAPVRIPCGDLSYTGAGAGTVQVDGAGTPMTGNLAAGQTLRIVGSVNSGTFTSAGRITGGGTINGSLENSGVVAPGESPGTLTVTGSYVQTGGGRLEIEVAGTGAGQHDVLALGGTASLGGTLALLPSGGYADSAAIGDSVSFLTYGGSAIGQFASTTVNPALSCGKAFATSIDEGAKALKASVVAGNPCPSDGGGKSGPPPPPPPPVPNTKIGIHPGAKVFTKQAKLKVKFSFSSDVAGATFECKLDKGAYKPCRSPKSFKVKPGKHKLSVRAVGPGGTDASPATAKFKVIRQKG
jgi:hypothetical protein